jgi:phosphoglycerate dehydrogenase-like enzyme
MEKTTVLVLAERGESAMATLAELRDAAEIVIGDSTDDFESAAANAEVIFNWSGSVSLLRDVFLICPRLRWIHSRSVGLERTLFPELIASNVVLTNGRGVFSPSLGEFVVGAILHFAKDFRRMIRNQMAGCWEQFDVTMAEGKTLGIIGYGDIGRASAQRARALGMNILAVKRHVAENERCDSLASEIYPAERRTEMLSRCDYVLVAAPLNAETRGLLSTGEFAAMKADAVVINVGRGPVIDEQALIRALSERKIKGAALDVFDEEPLPAGHPFYSMENVLLSPHCADHTSQWLEDAVRLFVEQFQRFRCGQPLLHVVNKKLGY